MPLGPFEAAVLRLLAGNRNPDSFVGGATVLHQSPLSPRTSQDVDVFAATQVELNATPVEPPPAFLILRSGERAGQQYRLARKQILGRDNAEIIIRDPRMSRSHASVEVFGTEYLLRDLSSGNHTYLNNQIIQQPTVMKHGDKIRVGNTEFEFIIKEK